MLEQVFDSIDNEYRKIRFGLVRGNQGDPTRLYRADSWGGGGASVAPPAPSPSAPLANGGFANKYMFDKYVVIEDFIANHVDLVTKRRFKKDMIIFAKEINDGRLVTKRGFVISDKTKVRR